MLFIVWLAIPSPSFADKLCLQHYNRPSKGVVEYRINDSLVIDCSLPGKNTKRW